MIKNFFRGNELGHLMAAILAVFPHADAFTHKSVI